MGSFTCYVFIVLLTVSYSECNMTDSYNTMNAREFQSRFSRLLSFNTQDNGDISMELAFNVPFITIPVKKSVDMAQGAIANVNIGAILLGGAITFGFAVVIPAILLLISKKSWGSPTLPYRREDSPQWWEHLNLLDQVLTDNNIDTTSCMQKIICSTVQNSAVNIMRGRSSSSDKIIDGLATSKWLQEILEGTVVHSAIQNGLGAMDCSRVYSQCTVSDGSFQMLVNKLVESLSNMRK